MSASASPRGSRSVRTSIAAALACVVTATITSLPITMSLAQAASSASDPVPAVRAAAPNASGAATPAPMRLPDSVQRALQSAGIPLSAVGLVVQQIGTNTPLLSHNATAAMNPASVMKLVTTYTALSTLGPAWRWHTDLLATAPVVSGVLEGDLYIRGSGDPKLVIERVRDWLQTLRTVGVEQIRGDLVFDRSLFEAVEIDPARFDQEPTRPYNVGPDPLLMNFKAVRFQFLPEPGRALVPVRAEPMLAQVDWSSSVSAAAGPCGDWRADIHAEVQSSGAGAKVRFSGRMPSACGEHSWYLGLLSHPEYDYGLIRSLWTELGGTLTGSWRDSPTPADARVLASAESAPLAEIVRDINKFSNNVMARQVFLALSAPLVGNPLVGSSMAGGTVSVSGALGDAGLATSEPPPEPGSVLPGFAGRAASTQRSVQVVRTFLRTRDLDLTELVLENGSGLSRIERISPQSLARLLINAWDSSVMPEFVTSLPIAGVDGTLAGRSGLRGLAGDAHIKTGSLSDVRAIAGYVQDTSGRRFVLAMLVNHVNAGTAIAAQDALIRWVHDRAGLVQAGLGAPASTTPHGSSAIHQSTAPAARGRH